MAEAVVTVKLSPDELRTILYALDAAIRTTDESVKAMSPSDGRGMRAMLAKMTDLRGKL